MGEYASYGSQGTTGEERGVKGKEDTALTCGRSILGCREPKAGHGKMVKTNVAGRADKAE